MRQCPGDVTIHERLDIETKSGRSHFPGNHPHCPITFDEKLGHFVYRRNLPLSFLFLDKGYIVEGVCRELQHGYRYHIVPALRKAYSP